MELGSRRRLTRMQAKEPLLAPEKHSRLLKKLQCFICLLYAGRFLALLLIYMSPPSPLPLTHFTHFTHCTHFTHPLMVVGEGKGRVKKNVAFIHILCIGVLPTPPPPYPRWRI